MTGISNQEALDCLELESEPDLLQLFARAADARRALSGDRVDVCSIINARCGNCGEDCAFCAQSSRSKATVDKYPLVASGTLFEAAKAASNYAGRFGIVTSGRAVKAGTMELDTICEAVGKIRAELPIRPCASLGVLSPDALARLRDAGLERYHHNLETAGSFFPRICGTRTYADQLAAVEAAKAAGLSVCSGGIFGLGESKAQRVELLDTIRQLEVDSVPMNFLTPIKGTLLENIDNGLTPRECLKTIAVARLMLPGKNIRLCGGREHNLRDFQSWIFTAGADGLMMGGYLTTPGRAVEDDLRLIAEAGMRPSQ